MSQGLEAPTFSVVIATYDSDRWDDLRAAVAAVTAQTYPAHEIIVGVDNNPELLRRVRAELPSIVAVPNDRAPGAGGARNAASAAASGDVLAFIDDDVQVSPGWLAAAAPAFADPRTLGVGGAITPNWLTRRPWWFPVEFDWIVGCTFRGSPTRPMAVRNLIAANMLMRRDRFEALDGFRHDFGKIGTRSAPEETDLCIRAGQRWPEHRWWYVPAVSVRHNVPAPRTTVRYFLRRCWLEGRGKADLVALVGPGDGTSDERRYAAVVLPAGVLRYLGEALRGRPSGLGRAAMVIAGLGWTAAGYLAGRVSGRRLR